MRLRATRLGVTGLNQSAGEYLTINGGRARLLVGADGQPLMGLDGQYLYGRV